MIEWLINVFDSRLLRRIHDNRADLIRLLYIIFWTIKIVTRISCGQKFRRQALYLQMHLFTRVYGVRVRSSHDEDEGRLSRQSDQFNDPPSQPSTFLPNLCLGTLARVGCATPLVSGSSIHSLVAIVVLSTSELLCYGRPSF